MARDLVIRVEDRPGALAEVCEVAGLAGINLDGGCGFLCEGNGVFHVLVDDVSGFRRVSEGRSFHIMEEQDVLVIDMDDRPGALGDLLRRIADEGVNINLLYLATRTRAVIGTDDPDRARLAVMF